MLRLVIGDKHRSSWSLRPWLLLRHCALPFEEIRLPLDTERFRDEIGRYTPTGRVPALLDGELTVWDSLAICEYVDELTGGSAWPADASMRATARSLAAEMHSGFAALRSEWSMQAALDGLAVPLSAEARADLGRIDAIWRECREHHGARGPWLFGDRYSIADAMYAPVVLRCRTYGASLSPPAHTYYSHALNDPHLQEWIRAARDEIGFAGRPRDHA